MRHAEAIISLAEKSIMLIDNYVNEETLKLLGEKNRGVEIRIYTWNMTNAPLRNLKRRTKFSDAKFSYTVTKEFHDRYLIVDEKRVYLLSRSLKFSGKRGFHITRLFDYDQSRFLIERAHFCENCKTTGKRKVRAIWEGVM